MRGISWLSVDLLASQEGLCSMELAKSMLEDSVLLRCEAESLGNCYPMFRRNMLPIFSRINWTNKDRSIWPFETLGPTDPAMQRHIPEDLKLLKHRYENLRYLRALFCWSFPGIARSSFRWVVLRLMYGTMVTFYSTTLAFAKII
jgi:hypothetical protein